MHNNSIECAPFHGAGPRLRSAIHAGRYAVLILTYQI